MSALICDCKTLVTQCNVPEICQVWTERVADLGLVVPKKKTWPFVLSLFKNNNFVFVSFASSCYELLVRLDERN